MKKIIYISGLTIFVLCIVLFSFLIKVYINCKTQYGECPKEVLNSLSTINGKGIFVAKREIKKILGLNLLTIKHTTQFKLPNTLEVEISIRKPVFALKSNISNSFALVDKDGQVLETIGESNLPSVTISDELPKVGTKVDERYLTALTLINGVYKMYQTPFGVVQSDTLLVDLPAQVRVIFPLVGADTELLLGSLRLIYSNIQNGEGNSLYNEIDMRYKSPVLRTI